MKKLWTIILISFFLLIIGTLSTFLFNGFIPNSASAQSPNPSGERCSNGVYYLAWGENLLRRFVYDGSSWILETIGTVGSPPNSRAKTIEIGDAKNDGSISIYVGTDQIYEFRWTGMSWIREVISPLQPYAMDIGDADNDGKNEIYVGSANKVYQIRWMGGSWVSTLIGQPGEYNVVQPIVGDVEGHDSKNELYVSGYDRDISNEGFVQFKWTGSSWIRTVLGGAEQPYYGIELGDGDNDGHNEVYQMNANRGVYQYKWTATGWSKMKIISYFLPTYPEIGDGDNDGQNEIYVVRNPESYPSGGIYQHKWNGSSWTENIVEAPNTRRKAVGDGDNDGKQEIYAGESTLYQIRWNGSAWVSTEIGLATSSTSSFIQCIVVGIMPDVTLLIQATIDIDPDTLNLKSKGKWITAYIELPSDYDISDIDVSTIRLNDTVSVESKPISIGDYDDDGILDLMVKFDRADVINILKEGDDVSIKITGELSSGPQFEGTNTIKVIRK